MSAPWICSRCDASNGPHVDRCGCSPVAQPSVLPFIPQPIVLPSITIVQAPAHSVPSWTDFKIICGNGLVTGNGLLT